MLSGGPKGRRRPSFLEGLPHLQDIVAGGATLMPLHGRSFGGVTCRPLQQPVVTSMRLWLFAWRGSMVAGCT